MNVVQYLNPISRLGNKRYSTYFPLFTILIFCCLSEIVAYLLLHNPMIVGMYAIFIPVALIIYFAFRDGIKGGLISTSITILYYFYIIYTRHYQGGQLSSGIDTTLVLLGLYMLLSVTIGWLKQRIDALIDREVDAKNRLQTILEQLPVGILITDERGRLTQRNQQIDKILGATIPIGFQLGHDTLPDVKINGQPVKPLDAPLVHVLKTGRKITQKEMEYQRKDGKRRFIQISSAPIHNRQKKIIAAASIINDITTLKELERQKDDFLSMASHELKTPITSLKMFIELQKKEVDSLHAKKASYFNDRIRDQVDRLKELTNDLLDVSRIQTGKLHLNAEKFPLSEVIADTIEGLQGTTKRHTIEFKSKFKGDIVGDRYRIYQVLVNLIANAIKYSPHGEKIIVEVKKGKSEVVVSVKDFGIGIKKEQQKKIFDRLYQVADPKEKTFPGLGLGLYISKEIVERHQGKMWVASEEGKGSTFFFSLPVAVQTH